MSPLSGVWRLRLRVILSCSTVSGGRVAVRLPVFATPNPVSIPGCGLLGRRT